MTEAAVGFEEAMHQPGLPGGPAVELVGEAMAAIPSDDLPAKARLQAALGRALGQAGRTEEAIRVGEEALAWAREVSEPSILAAALQAALIPTTDPERQLELGVELDALAARTSDRWSAGFATGNLVRTLLALGRLEEARTVLDRHRAFSSEGRFAVFEFMSDVYEGCLALAAGDFAEAEAAAEKAHTRAASADSPFDAGVYGLQMFAIRREQGRLGEVAPVVKLIARVPNAPSMWRPGVAALYAELGMLDDAARELDRLAGDGFGSLPRDSLWPACVSFLADACVAVGAHDHARLVYDELLPFRGRNLMVGMTICLGPADRYLANLARLLGRTGDATRHFEAALALAERSGSPVWEAHVRHDWAKLLVEQGDAAGAADLGARARDLATVFAWRHWPPPRYRAWARPGAWSPRRRGARLPTACRRAKSRCCSSWPTAARTGRSGCGCTSAPTPRPTTCAPSCARPARPTGPKPPLMRLATTFRGAEGVGACENQGR